MVLMSPLVAEINFLPKQEKKKDCSKLLGYHFPLRALRSSESRWLGADSLRRRENQSRNLVYLLPGTKGNVQTAYIHSSFAHFVVNSLETYLPALPLFCNS